jgi:glycosyltransferase involved in cell wall biosynthesis
MPTYNGSKTIGMAIRSVLEQTCSDFELLVLDDRSTDGTAEIARGIADPRIRVMIASDHKGLAGQLNDGIDLARGHYLARCDQDDILYPERLRRQADFLDAHPETDLVACKVLVFDSQGVARGLLPYRETHEEITARPWATLFLPHPTWMGRIEWFRRHRYQMPEVVRGEDQELLLRSYPHSRFATVPEILYGYRQERFSLKKTLQTRLNLARMHVRVHLSAGRYRYALLAPCYLALKAALDIAASIPGLDWIFFRRMSLPCRNADLEEWQRLWDHHHHESARGGAENPAAANRKPAQESREWS